MTNAILFIIRSAAHTNNDATLHYIELQLHCIHLYYGTLHDAMLHYIMFRYVALHHRYRYRCRYYHLHRRMPFR